ncbi:GmrSD restriction endonuclease domain-containing protein [Micromonospora yangpuensis]|uniref:HNH endonuclease n=1 Tax=Micromonospora yangpuensis TaxID=683228 RepID=A0A1C6U4C3_9ACTN|nr:DUF262 domain-containing protein [Micromonospora yangpuensis]GGL92785.1 hypothetical protein GCM10012279_08030 [Micromonospora yangpuensis]SCL48892.1 HNH endonuclease [Micromonospora yangpuensis]
MPTHHVNLDALIPREDFELAGNEPLTQPSILSTSLKVTDLVAESLIYNVLRKPDFQRETASWPPDKVAELVRSFLEGDLIPSVIMWRSPISGSIFVIDGAHRLSALVAWAHDDYGDRQTSSEFFNNVIPVEQRKAAEATRSLIAETVGSYRDLSVALRNPEAVHKEHLRLARNLSAFAVSLQWVMGEAEKAESSFFRINQQATPIDQAELEMIKARRKPNAVAARAFIRAGTGHKYWSSFGAQTRSEIEKIAKEVYDLIFKPSLDTSIRSADLPVAGRGYSSDSVKMVFELVNFVNGISPETWRRGKVSTTKPGSEAAGRAELADDHDGENTLRFMRAVRKAASRIAGNDPASLGLHPAVYFYSATGRFQPAAFLSAISFVTNLVNRRHLNQFMAIRADFEEFLVTHKYFLNHIVRRHGSLTRSVSPITVMLETTFESLTQGEDTPQIVNILKNQPDLRTALREVDGVGGGRGKSFSTETKNVIILKEIIDTAPKCRICGARLPLSAASFDHIVRRADGGSGTRENAQLTHPYCNTGFKESIHSRESGVASHGTVARA